LKPANLLVDSKWNLKISDFGMSRIKYRAYLQKSNPELEMAGGTPEWMSPEALRNDNVDELSDVYSFGIILWELITLNFPWHELNDPVQIVGKVAFLHHRPKIPSWVEPEMEQLLSDCWSRESCDRPEFTHILELLQTMSTPGAWSLGKGDNALEVKRSKLSQYLQDEQLEAAVNAQDEPETNSFFGFGGMPFRSKESGSLTSIASSRYDDAEDPYIPGKSGTDGLDTDNDSDVSREGKLKSNSTGGIGHQRRESHENILAFRPHSLTGLTIKTPAPKPDGKEYDRPDDKGLAGLKVRIGNKRTPISGTTSSTTATTAVAEARENKKPSTTLEQLTKLEDELDDEDLDDDDETDEEDLESEVSGFSQLSEAQQQKMNKFKEQQIEMNKKKKRLSKSNGGSMEGNIVDGKGNGEHKEDEREGEVVEEEDEPKTPRKSPAALFAQHEDGDVEERAQRGGDAFPSRPAAAFTGAKMKSKKSASRGEFIKPSSSEEKESRSKTIASQL
jgi:serine/threonine protein kinase